MTERLDRIEAILEQSAQQAQQGVERLNRIDEILAATAMQQAQNTEGIDTLLGAISTAEVERQRIFAEIATSNSRFETLRSEAIADRQEFRTQADADRAESARRFDAAIDEIRAQGQQIRALLSALATTNGRVDTLEQAS